MRLYDKRDIDILASTINAIAPDSTKQRAMLIIEAASQAMVFPVDLEKAIATLRMEQAP